MDNDYINAAFYIGGKTFSVEQVELKGLTTTVTTPVIYALGTVTTFVSFSVIGISIACYIWLKRKKG